MKWYILTLFLFLSFGAGWVASSFARSASVAPVQQAQPTAVKTATPYSDPTDIYSGNGMTPAALYDTLNTLSGVDFDKRYINYAILMQADFTGINRLAKEKAVAPTLKERATRLWELDSQRLTDLYALQTALGYSHH